MCDAGTTTSKQDMEDDDSDDENDYELHAELTESVAGGSSRPSRL